MESQPIYLVIQKDSLDRNQVVMAFINERDADNYVSDRKKKDDRYGLTQLRYTYCVQQVLLQPVSIETV